jgi:uncharacterized protein (DUF302 family)
MILATVQRHVHLMARLNVFTEMPFGEFCTAFEQAAPVFDVAPFLEIAGRADTTWDDVEKLTHSLAPHDLMIYARIDVRPLVALAGLAVDAVEYLLGNHVIATSMLRHDANALLYAPLRVLVYSDPSGCAVFAIDRPSTVFAGLDNNDIAATGVSLDHKVAALLRAIGVDTGDALT